QHQGPKRPTRDDDARTVGHALRVLFELIEAHVFVVEQNLATGSRFILHPVTSRSSSVGVAVDAGSPPSRSRKSMALQSIQFARDVKFLRVNPQESSGPIKSPAQPAICVGTVVESRVAH